jgi:DNA repair protein RecN (Recombination protein N)
MLQDIFIKNFVLIDQLELHPEADSTMITGETGAGKSIILAAIDLALGGRASAGLIKQGAALAEISVRFDVEQVETAKNWLRDHELDADNECLIRRTLSRDGKSRCYINGSPSSVQKVKQIASLLVSIHGQHENQSLMKTSAQMTLVDGFSENQSLVTALQKTALQWKECNKHYAKLKQQAQESVQRAEFLTFQLDEFKQADLNATEIASLPKQHKQLAHAEDLQNDYKQATLLLKDADTHNVCQMLASVQALCEQIKPHDETISESHELINHALILCEEAYHSMSHHLQQVNCDPSVLAHVEQRMSILHALARKHRVKAEELPALYANMLAEFDSLAHLDGVLEERQIEMNELAKKYNQLASTLSKRRAKAVKHLNTAITERIHQLGMPKAIFTACLQAIEVQTPNEYGHEKVEFQIMTNPGSPPQALTKIASGGELSRISLAIQVITAQHIAIPTLFFDEVDVGIGGTTAAIVGRLLRQLGKSHQVICITHQPQVAASAAHHWHVEKALGSNNTDIAFAVLEKEQRIDELARMLGGITVTEQTTAHAKEMLELHQNESI